MNHVPAAVQVPERFELKILYVAIAQYRDDARVSKRLDAVVPVGAAILSRHAVMTVEDAIIILIAVEFPHQRRVESVA